MEMLRELCACPNEATALAYFPVWCKRVIHTCLAPLKKLVRPVKQQLAYVVNYHTYEITNAVAEGINSKIVANKRRVESYRNRKNFKTAIYLYCGALELNP